MKVGFGKRIDHNNITMGRKSTHSLKLDNLIGRFAGLATNLSNLVG
jgi:hypothetical protein